MTITQSSGLQKDEVEKMVADARDHESEDKARRELIEVKNRAEQLVYQMEKLVSENKDKISADSVKAIEEGIQKVNAVREGQDKQAIEDAMNALTQASHKAAEEMYKAAAASGGTPPPPGGEAGPQPGPEAGAKKDDVVDAEFRTN